MPRRRRQRRCPPGEVGDGVEGGRGGEGWGEGEGWSEGWGLGLGLGWVLEEAVPTWGVSIWLSMRGGAKWPRERSGVHEILSTRPVRS